MVILDGEVRAFFSDRQRLTQIDQLHQLLFQCLQAVQTGVPKAIKKRFDEIASQRPGMWARRDDAPVGRSGKALSYEHIGLVYARKDARWPSDLWVHFGHYPNAFKGAWVGIYTLAADDATFKRIQEQLTPVLGHAEENAFTENEAYPIFKNIEDWPKGCASNRVDSEGSVLGLERLIDDSERGAVASVSELIVRMLDALRG